MHLIVALLHAIPTRPPFINAPIHLYPNVVFTEFNPSSKVYT